MCFYHIFKKIATKTKIMFRSIGEIFSKKAPIIDISGIKLTPGNHGRDCRRNGFHTNSRGKTIECCCDECDYFLCCFGDDFLKND